MLDYGKVMLRPLEESDLEKIAAWRNNPEVAATLVNVHESLDMVRDWYERIKTSRRERNFIIIDKESGKAIGHAGLAQLNFVNRNAELFIIIGEPAFWGRGYGRDVVRALLSYGFQELNLARIYLDTVAFNERALRCYKACGFVEEGRLRKARFKQGRYHDVILMSILREEWID